MIARFSEQFTVYACRWTIGVLLHLTPVSWKDWNVLVSTNCFATARNRNLVFCHYYGFWYDERGCLDIAFLQFLELLARSLFFSWKELIWNDQTVGFVLVGLCRCNMYTVYVLKGFNPFYNESNHYKTLNFGWFVCWLDFFPTCFYIPQKHNFGWHYSLFFGGCWVLWAYAYDNLFSDKPFPQIIGGPCT